MSTNNYWDQFYQRPLEDIPWQATQADWFKKLIDRREISGENALDLGCGVGAKSIYLAQNSTFKKIVGIDISKKAVNLANKQAKKGKLDKKCEFIQGDLTNWQFLDKKTTFDFILDWACIHCIDSKYVTSYCQEINAHSHSGTKLLIRTFTTTGKSKQFIANDQGLKTTIALYKRKDIVNLFPNFKIIKTNTSKPKSKKQFGFLEILMQKI